LQLSQTAIQCPLPKDDNLYGSVVNTTGRDVNDEVVYKCPLGDRVSDTESVYYTLTCARVPNTTKALWTTHPQFEGFDTLLFLLANRKHALHIAVRGPFSVRSDTHRLSYPYSSYSFCMRLITHLSI